MSFLDKDTIVIAIDHGWSQMKTVSEIFSSGIKEITTQPALYENVLEFDNKYYKVGGRRVGVNEDKIQDENYYLLTLAAMAKELDKRGNRNAHVLLAVGLPLTRIGKEKDGFIQYLNKNREVNFKFEKKQYHVVIERVSVYPQCYAAMVDKMMNYPKKVLAVDIGSWTLDILPIINQSPDESISVTKPAGIITCIQQINKECVRQLNEEVDEYDIQNVMMNGAEHLPLEYQRIIVSEIEAYCQKVFHYIKELGYNMDLTPIVMVGGGAGVMKRFGGFKQSNIKYIEDVKANAIGYDFLGNIYLERVLHRLG